MSRARLPVSWLQEMLANLVVASGVGYVATAYTISRWLTRGALRPLAVLPSDLDLAWEPLECRTEDGLRLAGWVVSPPRPRATVALFHGLRSTREQTLDRTLFLTAAGYRCVAFDHRAHGESDGRRTSFGLREARDVTAVLGAVRRRWPDEPYAALGISMGAAALCYAGRQPGCCAFVLESLYHDLSSAFRNRIGCGYPVWFKRFVPGVIWLTERRLRARLSELVPANFMPGLGTAPVLLLTGGADPHATPEDAERLMARCQGRREMYIVAGAGHRDVCEVGGSAYQQRVLDFLGRSLAA